MPLISGFQLEDLNILLTLLQEKIRTKIKVANHTHLGELIDIDL